ncbi:branched-chain amino acid ABC transporter permease [Hoeflea sp. WL0058]|uniref:Branched-chain amino acid ABC transporter permease n=1 Tax=Flavimaribacter sediminis TaxID=2865987 RepID=A0AAE2ZIM3_9HYPH|nr:branched-chain amino acid ABC transporter permease [Flavimaribacter sediminis]MBW8635656.1 branched-chain amino acid ABC transporter permease [Flavimaribacter sediminis]
MISVDTFLFVLASGVLLGGLYALMATGLAVVWTTLGVFNFAHGVFVALGAYIAWQVTQSVTGSVGYLLGAALSVVLMFGVGFVLHYVLVKPFERNANLVLLAVITTLAAASIIENGILLVWGARDKQIAPPISGTVGLMGAEISANDVMILMVALLALLVLAIFLRRTAMGRAMRAVAQNREAAELMGLNVSRLYAMTIGLSAATAALAGVFIGSVRFISPTFGSDPLMKSLIVVILGGVARFTSPILAAFIVGIAESFSVYFLGLYWAPAVLFAMMIAVLLIKPEGLFGHRSKTL